jgi:hypothetical protein
MSINLLIAIPFLFVLIAFLVSSNCFASELSYWVTHGTTCIKPDAPPGENKTAIIKAAKNEYEPFQVILQSQENIKNVDLVVSNLSGADGRQIGKENITLFREHFVYVRTPSYRSDNPPGWYPDALIPFVNPITGERVKDARFVTAPFDMWKGINEAIWVDVFVPKDTTPGDYKGELAVTVGGKETLTVPISLIVWDFALPDVPSMKADFGGYERAAKWHNVNAGSQEFQQIEMRYCKAMADHRVCPMIPDYLHPKPNPDGSISTEETHSRLKEFIETMHVNSFQIRFGTGYPYSDPLGADRDKAIRYLRSLYDYLNENGWAEMAYTYMIDEPNDAEAYDKVRAFAKLLHEANPKLKFLCTEQTKTQDPNWGDFYGYVDIWVPLWPLHDEENAQERLNAGDELWSYTALCQGEQPSPFWQLDFPVLNYRIPMWGSWRYQMKGLLYWSVIFWEQVKDPWLDQLTIYRHYNGDGSLLYPGTDAGIDGPVTSIRLKNVREGMEDYEYFKILSDLGDNGLVDEQVRKIIQTWFTWEKDPERLMETREQLALRILELRHR